MKGKLICVIMAIMMTLLCACGSDAAPDDPNIGVYRATKASMSGISIGVESMFEEGFTIELKNKGKGRADIDGEGANIKWSLEGEKFHAEGGGVVFDGTLRDGVMVIDDLQDSGVALTLVCDELAGAANNTSAGSGEEAADEADADASGDPADNSGGSKGAKSGSKGGGSGSSSEKPSTTAQAGSGDAGRWTLFSVNQNGQNYLSDQLAEKGIEAWMEMEEDGTGQIYLVGDLVDMEWSNGVINTEEGDTYTYTVSNEYLVLIDEDMVLTFINDGSNASAGSSSDMGLFDFDAEMSEDLMRRYEGDWHGLMLFGDADGDTFAERDNKKCDVIARICLDEDGNVTNPFFVAAMKMDPETHNFRNVTAELDPVFDGMYISGDFLDGGSFDTVYVDVTDGLMFISMNVTADNGDSIGVTIGMRRPDDKWTDDDYPRYSDEGADFYKGKSLEQIMSTFGNPPKSMPEQTHVTDWEL